jgi:hypothetical protein
MRRKLLAVVSTVTALVLTNSQPAMADQNFPGAGWVVHNLSSMQVTFKMPMPDCSRGETSTVVIGLISPATGTLYGWNSAAVVGCSSGTPWGRIQVWVNDVGGGHKVYGSQPGDVIRAQITGASTAHPVITAADLTTRFSMSYRLTRSAPTAAAGGYAGLQVPCFAHVNMNVWANDKPLHRLLRNNRIEYRGSTKLMAPGDAWGSQGEVFSLYWKHH